jgi:glycine betaine/proline transport system permease protein
VAEGLHGQRIPVGDWFSDGVNWVTATFEGLFDGIGSALQTAYDSLDSVLTAPPTVVMAALLGLLGLLLRGWVFGVLSTGGLLLVAAMAQWENAMHTLALVLVASAVAVGIAIPVGIAAARSARVSSLVRPVLDLMQTMPAFVYLIPAVIIFSVGTVPGIVATIVFAIPPGVRFTELGIRQVDKETVEAGMAFGSPPRKILRQVQLPLAMPTIMAGVNQVIMLALSMVVIAGIVGGAGLGRPVIESISRLNIGLGFEAGLSVVILAIYLDRLTAALGQRSAVARATKASAR